MGTFQFKKFSVVNERSAMKVNTDGVLLGAVMTIKPEDRTLLDIGTGTGTIALMAAQRLSDVTQNDIFKATSTAISPVFPRATIRCFPTTAPPSPRDKSSF